jgi:HK97 family phage major capsid protein
MRLDEINKRLSAIKLELDVDGADLDVLETEIASLKEERKGILDKAEKRKALMDEVATMPAEIIKDFKPEMEERKMEQQFNVASPEYRSAFFKRLAEEQLTEVEQRAFTHTTANTEAVLPVETVRTIWNLIEEQHSILGDITLYRTGTVLELTKHTAIVDGDAAQVSEASANADEQNTFVKVTLSGKDFSKHVEISYALGKMTAGALEEYLSREIAERLGAALAREVIAQIGTDIDSGNGALATASDEVKWEEIAKAFGSLKNAGAPVVYVNNATLYNKLVSMTDSTGRPLFQPSMQAGVQGVLMGASVKVEEALADNVILVGDPKKVVGNMIQDVMVEFDKDIKRHVFIYSGYARFECSLVAPKAFAKLTVTAGV